MKAGEIVNLDNLVEACGFFVGNTETFGGYGCSHPAQESRDSDTGEGQCDHCPLAWRLCPAQEEEDAALMIAQGYEPENGEGNLLCLNVDVHDTGGLVQGSRIWWRVAGRPELESCLIGSPFEPRHRVRLADNQDCVFEGATLGEALGKLAETKITEINARRFALINEELEGDLEQTKAAELDRLQAEAPSDSEMTGGA